jgi:peptide deformylase
MARLPVLIAPDPHLKIKAKPVALVDDAIRQLLDDMLETMYASNGIGLAGPQVGSTHRVIVADCARQGEPAAPLQMVNPEIAWKSPECQPFEEGCLSVPELYGEVIRPSKVRIRYLDRNGERQEIEPQGLLSVCLQHEIDHLDGVLFLDYLSPLKRNIILRKLTKAKRSAAVA